MKTFLKTLFITQLLIVLVLLTGCAEWQVAKSTVRDSGAHIADESLKVTLWKLCNASSYGAIKRKFADNPGKSAALKTVCSGESESDLISRESIDEL